MFNRRGVVGPILTIFFIAFIVLVVLITAVGPSDPAIQALPDTIEKTYGVFSRILTPIFEGLYKLVAPADPDENVRMIAFGVFLLFLLIGTSTLRKFFAPSIAFIISGIVGLIGSRSLTQQIIKDSGIAGGPLAGASFIVGIVPLLIVNGMVDRWFKPDVFEGDDSGKSWRSGLQRLGIYGILAATYFIIYANVIGSRSLAYVYAIGIGIFALGDILLPDIRRKIAESRLRRTGRFIRSLFGLIKTTEGIERGATARAYSRGYGI